MQDPDDLLTIEQASKFLNVSTTSLRRWTNDGRLSCARIGAKRIRRFKREDLLMFLNIEPARKPVETGLKHTFIAGIAIEHGSHLCSFYTSDTERNKMAMDFLLDGLQQDCACLLVATPKASLEFITALRIRRPDITKDIKLGRLVISEYKRTAEAQLAGLEAACRIALATGAQTIRLVGNISEGLLAEFNASPILLQYEKDLTARISKKFPVVMLSQYDACRQSGVEMAGVMKRHSDIFCYPPDRSMPS